MSLHRFMSQDYPDYELHIVVDGRKDPAWKVVQEAAAAHPSVRVIISTLAERPTTCSPDCASLSQAAESAEGCEVVALADGDVVAHSELAANLGDRAMTSESACRMEIVVFAGGCRLGVARAIPLEHGGRRRYELLSHSLGR